MVLAALQNALSITSKKLSEVKTKKNYSNELNNINNIGLKNSLTKLIEAYNAKNN